MAVAAIIIIIIQIVIVTLYIYIVVSRCIFHCYMIREENLYIQYLHHIIIMLYNTLHGALYDVTMFVLFLSGEF